MRDTVRAITKTYLTAAVWFVVMLSTALVLLGPMGAIYAALDLAPEIRALGTMTIAIVTATAAAALVWSRLRAVVPLAEHAASDASEGDAEAPLATTG